MQSWELEYLSGGSPIKNSGVKVQLPTSKVLLRYYNKIQLQLGIIVNFFFPKHNALQVPFPTYFPRSHRDNR